MLKITKIQYLKILILYTLLALSAVCCYNFKRLFGLPHKRPFRCYDESLSKPFVAVDSVTPKQLYILGIYVPIALIAGCELFSSWASKKSLRSHTWLLNYVLKCSIILTLFLIGLAVERLFKNFAKLKMARLRPNFLTVCEPVNTNGYRCADEDAIFVTTVMSDYECRSDSYPAWAVESAFASFPSGHTSLTAYSMIFLICYLHFLAVKLKEFKMSCTLTVLIGQIFCLFMILFVGMSRILDFRHHWSDVFAGFICGSTVAVVLNWYFKSELENIEKWLKEIVSHREEQSEAMETCYVKHNANQREESCAIEVDTVEYNFK